VPLEPPDGGRGINDVSVVLLGEVAGRRILLTGDVEDDVDPLLVARGLPPIDVLKVAHHGSKTASTPAFLDVVKPAVAIVSAGAGNPYGHPARSTLDRLASTGARVLRTDTDGSVEVDIGASGIRVSASGGRAAAFLGRIGLTTRSGGGLLAGPTSAARLAVPGTLTLLARALVQAATPDEKRFPRAARPVITFAFVCAVPSSG
jgi:hypothetical protein